MVYNIYLMQHMQWQQQIQQLYHIQKEIGYQLIRTSLLEDLDYFCMFPWF